MKNLTVLSTAPNPRDNNKGYATSPRLSCRLLLALYGENAYQSGTSEDHKKRLIFLQHLTHKNNHDITKDNNKSSDLKVFDVNNFMPTDTNSSDYHERVQKLRVIFTNFIEEINKVCESRHSAPQKNAAYTMYKIITKNESLESSHKDVNSYFGFVNNTSFNKLVSLANDLQNASKLKESMNQEQSSSESSNHFNQIEFGSDINFQLPQLKLSLEEETIAVINDSFGKINININKSELSNNDKIPAIDSNYEWLRLQCDSHTTLNPDFPLVSEELFNEILKIVSNNDVDSIQMKLFDLFGEDGFEFMIVIMENLSKIKSIDQCNDSNIIKYTEDDTMECHVDFEEYDLAPTQPLERYRQFTELEYENLSVNQKRKIEQKEKIMLEKAINESKAYSNEFEAINCHAGDKESSVTTDWLQKVGFSEDFLLQERALGLQKGKTTALSSCDDWFNNLAPNGTLEYHEKKSSLPPGSTRKSETGYEEIFTPAGKRLPPPTESESVYINQLEPWAQKAFIGTKKLNRIQSIVYSCAYNSIENMLICAPTGAGKTNIAMLTFLQLVKQYTMMDGAIDKAAIKAVYIAPMKALAQEVVAKFSERLAPLGLVVKEFTGDMQLTRQEVQESNLLVSTPEKYDVVTRKGGDGSLGTLVSLIIIDEVHLLADEDRGAVIETIVARTQRYIESSQRFIRIVGLSATLPNYQDVAIFLRVNLKTGLFFFGPEYRPIPLDQTFVGVTEKQRVKRNNIMNKVAYDKMVAGLENGKQIMIFVHSRKETSMTAEAMLDLSSKYCTIDLLDNVHHEHFTLWKRQVEKSRSVEVQQLFFKGVGVHHAGMLRADRTMTEQLFECGLIKVLCCTATLAWGINLPAHTVIIKGIHIKYLVLLLIY